MMKKKKNQKVFVESENIVKIAKFHAKPLCNFSIKNINHFHSPHRYLDSTCLQQISDISSVDQDANSEHQLCQRHAPVQTTRHT